MNKEAIYWDKTQHELGRYLLGQNKTWIRTLFTGTKHDMDKDAIY